MGTRADFYVGLGPTAQWLGSVAFDGGEFIGPDWSRRARLLKVTDEESFRTEVADILKDRRDATSPHLGWPWPWSTSAKTDYAYAFVDGRVDVFCFGRPMSLDACELGAKRTDWPDMSDRAVLTLGIRSGLIVLD